MMHAEGNDLIARKIAVLRLARLNDKCINYWKDLNFCHKLMFEVIDNFLGNLSILAPAHLHMTRIKDVSREIKSRIEESMENFRCRVFSDREIVKTLLDTLDKSDTLAKDRWWSQANYVESFKENFEKFQEQLSIVDKMLDELIETFKGICEL